MTSNQRPAERHPEEAVPDRLSRLESIVDSSPMVIFACTPDEDFRTTYSSNGVQLLWGYDRDEFFSERRFWVERVHPEDRARVLDGLQRLLSTCHHTHEYRFHTRTGGYRWMRGNLLLTKDSAGKPLEIVGYSIDITAEKDSERALRESQEQLSLIFDSTSDGQMLIRVEPDGRLVIEAINRALCEILKSLGPHADDVLKADDGIKDDALKQDIEKFFALGGASPQQIEFRLSVLRRAIAEKTPAHYEMSDFPRGRSLEVVVSPVLDGRGVCTHLLWTGRDITNRIAAFTALRRETRDLNDAQRIAKVGSWYRTSKMENAVWSEEMYRIYGLDPSSPPPDMEKLAGFFTPETWERRSVAVEQTLRDGQLRELTMEVHRPDGGKLWIVARFEAERDPSGRIVGLRGTVQDVTEQRQMELELRTRETQSALIFNSTTDAKALLRITAEGTYRFEAVNRAYEERVKSAYHASARGLEGRERGEVLAEFGFSEEMIRHELPMYDQALREGIAVRSEVVFTAADGRALFTEVSVQPIRDGDGRYTHVLWSGQDISERKKAENQLRASLREKEILLREVHHRVKNNLQIISSLLHFQAKNATSAAAAAVFRQGQDRLRSMLLVHEKLYRSSNLAAIDFADYVHSLTGELVRSHELWARGIQLRVEAEPILLPAEIVLPCGMIINELVTNSFKHGFPPGRAGTIVVRIVRTESSVAITVEDDGVGMPHGQEAPVGFGADLVRNLTEQMGGVVTHRFEPGTKVTIQIPYDHSPHTV